MRLGTGTQSTGTATSHSSTGPNGGVGVSLVSVGLVAGETTNDVAHPCAGIGYIDRGDHEGSVGRLLVRQIPPSVRTVYVHVVDHSSHYWRDSVDFRDALIRNVNLRDGYAMLKRSLGTRYTDDRGSYTKRKRSFIKAALGDLERSLGA